MSPLLADETRRSQHVFLNTTPVTLSRPDWSPVLSRAESYRPLYRPDFSLGRTGPPPTF